MLHACRLLQGVACAGALLVDSLRQHRATPQQQQHDGYEALAGGEEEGEEAHVTQGQDGKDGKPPGKHTWISLFFAACSYVWPEDKALQVGVGAWAQGGGTWAQGGGAWAQGGGARAQGGGAWAHLGGEWAQGVAHGPKGAVNRPSIRCKAEQGRRDFGQHCMGGRSLGRNR